MSPRIDLVGMRFNRWLVIGRAENDMYNYTQFNCVCECGEHRTVIGSSLKTGNSKSCGCLRKEVAAAHMRDVATIHGGWRKPEYSIWVGMRRRCRDENHKSYKNYGARGITVCDRWSSFENFFADMGRRPSPKYTLDRYPNNDGPYAPDNCRWATWSQQAKNRRQNQRDEDGRFMPAAHQFITRGV